MKLNAQKPIIIIVGAWNPIIFQPGWIARYLLDIPEGKQIDVIEVITAERINENPVHYFADLKIGVFANSKRVEIYANDFDGATTKQAEKICIKLIQTLPHTPLGPFGINFHFVHENPDDHLLDILKTRDSIEQHFKIVRQSLTSTIEISPEIVLNFSRRPSAETVFFDFNYHHKQVTANTIENLLTDSISKHLSYSLDILKNIYGLTGYEIINHDLLTKPNPLPASGAT